MQFDSGSVDVSGVDDRRGFGGGGLAIGGGGLGVVGLILYFVVQALGGGGGGGAGGLPGLEVPGGVQAGPAAGGESREELQRRCNAEGALQRHTDCRLIKVYNVADDVWRDEFARRGAEYRRPTLTFFSQSVRTGCGPASSSTGPFYCPADQRIYIDLGFYQDLRTRFGARGGPFAEAYVIAHEYGHHVENLRGVLDKARDRTTGPQSSAVRVELMADCYAGLWARGAVDTGFIEELTEADIADGLDAAAAIGDDRIQEQAQGQVSPESWTHGSSEQRQRWFRTGYSSTDPASCDTFAARTV
jgi:hypothetical protein